MSVHCYWHEQNGIELGVALRILLGEDYGRTSYQWSLHPHFLRKRDLVIFWIFAHTSLGEEPVQIQYILIRPYFKNKPQQQHSVKTKQTLTPSSDHLCCSFRLMGRNNNMECGFIPGITMQWLLGPACLLPTTYNTTHILACKLMQLIVPFHKSHPALCLHHFQQKQWPSFHLCLNSAQDFQGWLIQHLKASSCESEPAWSHKTRSLNTHVSLSPDPLSPAHWPSEASWIPLSLKKIIFVFFYSLHFSSSIHGNMDMSSTEWEFKSKHVETAFKKHRPKPFHPPASHQHKPPDLPVLPSLV